MISEAVFEGFVSRKGALNYFRATAYILKAVFFPPRKKEPRRCSARAAEVGSGGGRVAKLVLPRVKELHCFDISPKMLERPPPSAILP